MTGARRDLPPAVTVKQIINRRLRYLAANLFLESRLYPADFQNAAVFSGVTKTLKPRCFFLFRQVGVVTPALARQFERRLAIPQKALCRFRTVPTSKPTMSAICCGGRPCSERK